ncbi:MAG: hypothetical protein HIU82_20700 [Proteobacteria bacterium]|nr:hypothetical protein [Pseudomonadota bacterium]
MPKNTVVPVLLGALAFGFGFALTWRIWWLTGLTLAGIIGAVILRSFLKDSGHVICAEEIRRMESEPRSTGITEDHISPPVAELEVVP